MNKSELRTKAQELHKIMADAHEEYISAIKAKRKGQADAAAALSKAARAKIQYMRVMGAIEETTEDEVA